MGWRWRQRQQQQSPLALLLAAASLLSGAAAGALADYQDVLSTRGGLPYAGAGGGVGEAPPRYLREGASVEVRDVLPADKTGIAWAATAGHNGCAVVVVVVPEGGWECVLSVELVFENATRVEAHVERLAFRVVRVWVAPTEGGGYVVLLMREDAVFNARSFDEDFAMGSAWASVPVLDITADGWVNNAPLVMRSVLNGTLVAIPDTMGNLVGYVFSVEELAAGVWESASGKTLTGDLEVGGYLEPMGSPRMLWTAGYGLPRKYWPSVVAVDGGRFMMCHSEEVGSGEMALSRVVLTMWGEHGGPALWARTRALHVFGRVRTACAALAGGQAVLVLAVPQAVSFLAFGADGTPVLTRQQLVYEETYQGGVPDPATLVNLHVAGLSAELGGGFLVRFSSALGIMGLVYGNNYLPETLPVLLAPYRHKYPDPRPFLLSRGTADTAFQIRCNGDSASASLYSIAAYDPFEQNQSIPFLDFHPRLPPGQTGNKTTDEWTPIPISMPRRETTECDDGCVMKHASVFSLAFLLMLAVVGMRCTGSAARVLKKACCCRRRSQRRSVSGEDSGVTQEAADRYGMPVGEGSVAKEMTVRLAVNPDESGHLSGVEFPPLKRSIPTEEEMTRVLSVDDPLELPPKHASMTSSAFATPQLLQTLQTSRFTPQQQLLQLPQQRAAHLRQYGLSSSVSSGDGIAI